MPIDKRTLWNNMFREQVVTLSNWFDRWGQAEQTVALTALMRRTHPVQARFLSTILQRQLSEYGDLRRVEILANDPNFVSSLATAETEAPTMRDILYYLPLLNPKNHEVKSIYLNFIPKALKVALEHVNQLEDARQLLSFSLIHPGFTLEERTVFTGWLRQFEEKLASVGMSISNDDGLSCHHPTSLSGSPPTIIDFSSTPWPLQNASSGNNSSNILSGSPATQSGGLSIGNFGGSSNFHRIRRSNSLTPPVLHSDAWNSQEDQCSTAKPRSLSLSSEIGPNSSLGGSGSGSESHLDDQRPTFTAPGMRDVPGWLKSLRLHKYAFLFAHLSFEEMMTLSEVKLEAQGVTKGARHKIILSITKLKERSAHLKKVCEEMTGDKESIRNALNEVKWTLTTPMKPALIAAPPQGVSNESTTNNSGDDGRVNNENSGNLAPIGTNRFPPDENTGGVSGLNNKGSNLQQQDPNSNSPTRISNDTDGDLSGWIVRTIGKACDLNPDMECEGLLISVLDKCLSHDGFTVKQKRLLTLWRQQQSPIIRRNSSGGHHPYFHTSHHQRNNSGSPGGGTSSSKSSRHFSPRILNLGGQLGTLGSSWSPGSSIHAMFMAKRPSLQDSFLEASTFGLGSGPPPGLDLRTSPPNPVSNYGNQFGGCGTASSAMDITSRLESLCLSMTEAALGSAFNI